MDINNNQQTNTFIKGMDTDTSDMYIGEGSYRYAENLRVVTNTDSNSGELHIIEGTKEIELTGDLMEGQLLGFTSIRNYIIAIVAKDKSIHPGQTDSIVADQSRLQGDESASREFSEENIEEGGQIDDGQVIVEPSDPGDDPINLNPENPDPGNDPIPSDPGVLPGDTSNESEDDGGEGTGGSGSQTDDSGQIEPGGDTGFMESGYSWSIYRIERNVGNNGIITANAQLIAGPFDEQIWPDNWNGKTKPLSLVTRWEADDNIKLYIATGKTELLVINIAETNQGNDFDAVFQSTKTLLEPLQASVGTENRAKIPGVILQYAYVVYKRRGQSSTMSSLSNVVTQTVNKTHGYEAEQKATKVVNLVLPSNVLVDIKKKKKCKNINVIDAGQSLQNVSTSEFISTNKLLLIPKEIESKGDYLFSGNVTYIQDDIDRQFSKFDARCFSKGSYYEYNNTPIKIWDDGRTDQYFENVVNNLSDKEIKHHQFDSYAADFDSNNWYAENGVNGHGLCFDWKYVYTTKKLFYTKQYDGETPRTYGRNEVYRFGVRLFDEKGNASSVKWIADIKMPPAMCGNSNTWNFKNSVDVITNTSDPQYEANPDYIYTNSVSIQFIPRNTSSEYWAGVSKYEIVQAKRSIEDSYKITQGICGFPLKTADEDCVCMPYFLTTQPFRVRRGFANAVGGVFSPNGFSPSYSFTNYTDALIFASPEVSYQPDDIRSLFESYKTGLYQESVSVWSRQAKMVTLQFGENQYNSQLTFNDGRGNSSYSQADAHILKYKEFTGSDTLPSGNMLGALTQAGTDLRIQFGCGQQIRSGVYEDDFAIGEYFLSSQVMHHAGQDSSADWEPIGGSRSENGAGKKLTYFTNMYPQVLFQNAVNDTERVNVVNTNILDAQSSDAFVNGEWPTYRSQFITLKNGKKFFNWTNPALISSDIYSYITAGGDQTKESWYNTTMTSYNNDYCGLKYRWVQSMNGDASERNAQVGSLALSFPTSIGGPCAILQLSSSTDQYCLPAGDYQFSYQNETATMPEFVVANVCKQTTPYGGYSISAINNTQYVSYGHFADKTSSVTVSDGDNFITMFTYCLYHNFDNAQVNMITTAALQYIVPIESTMDLSKQCSNYLQAINHESLPVSSNQSKGVWVQAHPSTVAGRLTQTQDMYMYNTAYSILPDVVTYSAEDTVNAASALYDSRIHYSQKKQNNELIDNWSNFKAIDFLDVDSRYGQITGLKLFKDKLVFLQENGAGVLSVNDRIILKDQESANIIVGNGGVLDRYDYFTTIYGMKPEQHAIESSNDALYWWDGHRREIISYVDGYNVQLLQRIKNVQDVINNNDEATTPSIVYDIDNKEVLFNVVGNDKTLVYNEQTQSFTSVYKFSPIYYCNINGVQFVTDLWRNGPNLYEYNKLDSKVKLFGKEVYPKLKYVVNKDAIYNKVFDIQTFGGRFYKGDKSVLSFNYYTPLKQHSQTTGSAVTDIEYDYRLAIPRNNNDAYGGRMRGKTMECELTSSSNDIDFSIQYVTTKYRMSWS